jgi:uncharacterized protein (DUF952 family)
MQPVIKLLRPEEWAQFQAEGGFAGSPDDLRDGYIHLSTPDQAAPTAAKWFAGVEGLVALTLDADALAPLKWEPARGGVMFPHLYRALVPGDIIEARPFAPA